MKILRYLATLLGAVAALLGLAALTAMVPAVQTWAAQLALNRQPGMNASVGSVDAGFGEVEIEDARIETGFGVLTVPVLRAHLPVLRTLWSGRMQVGALSAKGWTLDLSRAPAAPKGPGAEGPAGRPALSSAAQAASLVMSAIRTWQVPFAGTVDGVEVEGDVLLASREGAAPVQVHLVVKGGGLGAGRHAAFDVEATAVGAQIPAAFTFARGSVAADLGRDGRIGRLSAKAGFSPEGESSAENPGISAEVSADRSKDGSAYEIDAERGSRHLVSVRAQAADSSGRLAGTWSVDLREADIAPFSPYADVTPASATGSGSFDATRPFERLHAQGRLKAQAKRLGGLGPVLAGAGPTTLEAQFEVTAGSGAVTVARLDVSAGAAGAALAFRTLRPFDLDPQQGRATVAPGDFMEGSFRDLPLALLCGPASRIGFADGRAGGDFAVRATAGGFILELRRPAAASGVALLGPGRLLGPGLDASLSLKAAYSSGAWDVVFAPLVIRRAGKDAAVVEAHAAWPAGGAQAISVNGTFSLDPQALNQEPGGPGASLAALKSVTGSFEAKLTDSVSVTGKVAGVGRDPSRTASADFRADIDGEGDFTFNVPVRVAVGADASEFTADGGVSFDTDETRIEAKVEGDDVGLAHLGLLAGPLMALQAPPAAGSPAWGKLKGRVEFSFKKLRSAGDAFEGVNGVLTVDHGYVRLNGGRVWLLQHDLAIVTGILTFEPSRRPAYELKANVSLSDFDASAIFGKTGADRLALVEGRFALEDAVSSAGDDLAGVARAVHEQMQVRSASGILRLLKVDVADAIPEQKERVSETLGTVGSAVGAIFGIKHDSEKAGQNTVSKAAESVLSFTYDISEIGYDKLAATVVRDPQGGMHVADIEVTAPNEHISGSGDIGSARGLAFPARPISLLLRLAVKGEPAKLLGSAGLLSGGIDELGYSPLAQPIRLGGTLGQVDATPWHDMLAAVAAKAAAAGTKPK